MKILWITLESILPANSGGRFATFKRIERLSKTEDIYIFYPYDNNDEIKYEKELKKYCKGVYSYSRNENKKSALLNLFKYPYTISSRNIKNMQNDIKICIEKNKIDVIIVDYPHMFVNLLNIKTNIPIILNEYNIEWKIYKTISNSQKNILKKVAYFIDSFRLKKYENKIAKKFNIDTVTFVSSSDLEFFKNNYYYNKQKTKLELVPIGADLIEISKNKEKIENIQKNIIFVGKMSYGPNVEAVIWFVNNVFTKIHKQHDNVKFYIVGKDPTENVLNLASENVIVTGMVDSVEKYYDLADLVVIPLFNGGGVKVKLLEAISHNKKIVATTKGVEGTIYANGDIIPVSNNPKEFANLCIKSLMNDEEIIKRNEKAYKTFVENYTWENICENYKKIIENVVKNGR